MPDESFVGEKIKIGLKIKRCMKVKVEALRTKYLYGYYAYWRQCSYNRVPDTKAKTIKPVIEKLVADGAIIITGEGGFTMADYTMLINK